MAIVIDVNCLARVFNTSNNEHAKFAAVRIFVETGVGKVVYGGTGYKKELSKAQRYLAFVIELRKAGRAISIRDEAVDRITEVVAKATAGTDCDDPHIIGLLAASNCALLCSVDKRSYGFIRDRSFYAKNNVRVKIYSSDKNVSLLKKQRARLWNVG